MKQPPFEDLPPFLREALSEEANEAERRAALEAVSLLESQSVSEASLEEKRALLDTLARPPTRYAPFFGRVSELFEMREADVIELLGRTDWKRTPLPGIRYRPVETKLGRPNVAAALVRFSPGLRYPRHTHDQREQVLLLEGGYTDDRGQRYVAGDLHEMEAGSVHQFTVDRDGPCIAASVSDEKLRFTSPILRALAKLVGRG